MQFGHHRTLTDAWAVLVTLEGVKAPLSPSWSRWVYPLRCLACLFTSLRVEFHNIGTFTWSTAAQGMICQLYISNKSNWIWHLQFFFGGVNDQWCIKWSDRRLNTIRTKHLEDKDLQITNSQHKSLLPEGIPSPDVGKVCLASSNSYLMPIPVCFP